MNTPEERMSANEIGQLLQSLRADDEDGLIVVFGAHAPSVDCRNGHVSVTIEAGPERETSEAVSLADAIMMARAKVKAAAEKRRKDAEKAKADTLRRAVEA